MGGQVSVEGVHVVVVGGGFGGIAAAQDLKYRGFSFTLIDMRDAFHHNVGALRASVQPGFAQKTFIPYAATFGESFVQGRVELVDTDRQAVILEGGREIRYSHLILCTGTDGPFPGKFNMVAPYHTAVQKYENFIGQSFKRQEYIVIEEFPESSEEECGDSGSDEDWMPEQKGASRVARSSSDSDEGDEAQEKNMRVRKKKVRHMRQKMSQEEDEVEEAENSPPPRVQGKKAKGKGDRNIWKVMDNEFGGDLPTFLGESQMNVEGRD